MRPIKYQWLIIIPIIIVVTIVFCMFIPKATKYIEINRQNVFISDVKNINNLASEYFLRNLDPLIDKNVPNEGYVDIQILDKNNEYKDYKGIIKIIITKNNTNYYINVSNETYTYSGNIKDLNLKNIKMRKW